MPDFTFHRPRFLNVRRSRSRSPNQIPESTAQSSDPDPSRALSSLSLREPSILEQDGIGDAGYPHRPVVDNQNYTGHIPISGALDDSTGQLSSLSRSVVSNSVVNSDSATPVLHPRHSTSSQSAHQIQGMFHQAHNLSVAGNFIDGDVGNVVYITTPSHHFMEKFLKETIPGAAFDSSARDPPPRCHPGTRLAVLKRCIDFISNDNGKPLRWIVGGAGVGKSAILQKVAESPKHSVASQASVFFSVNGRNDGTKAIITLSYQLAAKSGVYRRVIEDEISCDPSLFQSSMAVQFEKFIVQPFIRHPHINTAGRVLIIIDGLDECRDTRTQIELLRLISNLCISYPSSPISWLIASRPETHIISFFSRAEVITICEREEIAVDSDEGRADVERFLRDTLAEIKMASESLDPQWPDEQDLWKLAHAAGGLFAYADTAMRYIGDTTIGSPALQLSDVLHVIDNHPTMGVPGEAHPMALLDALYARIISKVPSKVMVNTRQILLALASDWDSVLHRPSFPPRPKESFVLLCNWLHMTPDDAYAATNPFRSVLRVPRRDNAHEEKPMPFHKSFIDYISDFTRSGFSRDIQSEAQQLKTQCSLRILKEAADGVDFGEVDYGTYGGTLARGLGSVDKISLTWRANEEVDSNYSGTRMSMYKLAIHEVVAGIKFGDPAFHNVFSVRFLATMFEEYDRDFFPCHELGAVIFDESRRHDFVMYDILRETPLKAIDISNIFDEVNLQFRRPATAMTKLSDQWNSSCQHEREGEWEEGSGQHWETDFSRDDCVECYGRFERQLENVKVRALECVVPVLFTSAGECCVEVRFVDEEDGVSEWVYRFWCRVEAEECKKDGRIV